MHWLLSTRQATIKESKESQAGNQPRLLQLTPKIELQCLICAALAKMTCESRELRWAWRRQTLTRMRGNGASILRWMTRFRLPMSTVIGTAPLFWRLKKLQTRLISMEIQFQSSLLALDTSIPTVKNKTIRSAILPDGKVQIGTVKWFLRCQISSLYSQWLTNTITSVQTWRFTRSMCRTWTTQSILQTKFTSMQRVALINSLASRLWATWLMSSDILVVSTLLSLFSLRFRRVNSTFLRNTSCRFKSF